MLREIQCSVLAAALCGCVLYLDVSLPLGVAGGVPYVAVVAMCLAFRAPLAVLAFGFVGVALTLVGGALSPDGEAASVASLNRAIAILSILALTLMGYRLLRRHEELEEVLRRKVDTDPLTGVASRRRLWEELERRAAEAVRHRAPLSVLMLDVDHFKAVNDAHGHAVGDTVLQTVSARCAGVLRASDLIGRYGGEEFVVVCPQTSVEGALQLAERLRAVVAAPDGPGGIAVTVSVGVASTEQTRPSSRSPHEDLIRAADGALYTAKERGRNCVVVAGDPDEVAQAAGT